MAQPTQYSVLLLWMLLCRSMLAQELSWNNPLDQKMLDGAAFAQWVDGHESPVASDKDKKGASAVVWTRHSRPDWQGIKYGEGRAPGVRHLRIGFTGPVTIGSVLVRGGGVLSVLKSGADYPGNLADDSQWISAARLVDGVAGQKEAGNEDYALWVLPSVMNSRALRFSHAPGPGDREQAGWLGGVSILTNRFGNVAPQALAYTAARDDVSAKLVDESNNRQWQTWENGEKGAALPVSADHPELLTLVWPQPVKLDGLCLLWTGFSAADVEAYQGDPNAIVQEVRDADWKRVAGARDMDALYPLPLGVHWIPLGNTVNTRAIRLRITQGAKSNHSHLADKVKEGRRVWLGELMALTPLRESGDLSSIVLPGKSEDPPPVPIRFTLPEPGLVTLVVEDKDNKRVRNLIAETPFPAGSNVAWWDGSDDLLRDNESARHGLYHIPTRMVSPGEYKVRGLWHKPLQLRYEFSVYNAGHPAWETADKTGCWLTTHTPPTSMACVPGERTKDGKPLVFMGAFVAEGGHGLQWVNEQGMKIGGQGWVGGTWTGAPILAVDSGRNAASNHLCYVGSIWEGELRLTAKTIKFADQAVLKEKLGEETKLKGEGTAVALLEGFDGGDKKYVLGGMAAYDGRLVCSMVRQDELLVVDVSRGEILQRLPVNNPRGLTFDARGHLLVLSGKSLLKFRDFNSKPEMVIPFGLEDPRHVARGEDGRLYITDRGASHQVKVYTSDGKSIRAIGKPGKPSVGAYDALHLNNPNGIAVDSQGRIWVAEADDHPRRVSVWTGNGELARAFYGPTEYGGGGVLDPVDANRFFYKGLEFKLDWQNGSDTLVRVFARPDSLPKGHYGCYSPDTPLYPAGGKGERFFTSCYTHTPTGGDDAAFIWKDDGVKAVLVAALGNAHSWAALKDPVFQGAWPAGTNPSEERPRPETSATFVWVDSNNDGLPQPPEVKFVKVRSQGITVMNDLSFVVTRFGKQCVQFMAERNSKGGLNYDLALPRILGPAGGSPPSSGGNQSLAESGGWSIYGNAPEPFSAYGLGGSYKGEVLWSYPSPWPGLHASHEAAVPDRPGMVVGHTRLLGGFIQGRAGPMFCMNGNMGNMYLLTADGLFVSTLFHDIRLRPNWAAPVAIRNMDVTDVSLHDENFWPSITQTADGTVFLVDGGRTSLVRVDGLDTLQRLPDQKIVVGTNDLEKAREWFANKERLRQQQRGSGMLKVAMIRTARQVDGTLDDWPASTDWAFIDRRGTKANFNSDSRPYDVSAAVAINETHLYGAWRTTEKNLLNNSGETPNALFKHGGCLDIMLSASAAPGHGVPVAGDLRLLITQVQGQTRAMLYRAKVSGVKEPVAFSSPWRTIHIDRVEDVSQQVKLAADKNGNYEISIPLNVLGWQPRTGNVYGADIGILRGSNGQTSQRVYWANKATAITADIPSEAELTPALWGKWKIIEE